MWLFDTMDEPGKWFHGWKLPNPGNKGKNLERLWTFDFFRSIVSDLNEGSIVNVYIDEDKAQELYYHFLVKFFPKEARIEDLAAQFSHPNVPHTRTSLPVANGSSLICPPTSKNSRRLQSENSDGALPATTSPPVINGDQAAGQEKKPQVPLSLAESNESTSTVLRTGGELESSATTASEASKTTIRTQAPLKIKEPTGIIGSLATGILQISCLEQQPTMDKEVEERERDVKIQSGGVSDFGEDMMVDFPPATKPHTTPNRQGQRKRKSDEATAGTQAYIDQQPPKKKKAKSNHNMVDEQSVDEEMVDKFSKLNSGADTEAPVRKKAVQTKSNVRMASGSSNKPSLKEKQKEQVPVSLGQHGNHAEQVTTWLKLSSNINAARRQLQGDNLELFERLLAKHTSPEEVVESILKWTEGKLGTFERLREEAARPFDL